MKIIEDINNYINVARRTHDAKKMLENLTINWATDPKEMQFANLRSSSMFTNSWKFLRMDKIKIEDTPNFGGQDIFQGVQESLRFIDLIELMASGEKIIPPIYVTDVSFVDGVRSDKEPEFMDGSHRIRIAQLLQLKEIPIVVMERVVSYVFTVDQWSFKAKTISAVNSDGNTVSRDVIEATSNEGETMILNTGKYPPSIEKGIENDLFPKYLKINIGL
jgi:hypothetical protein